MASENKVESFLEGVLSKSEKEAESLSDEGHLKLMNDLTSVWSKAKQGKYHDFHKDGYATPKNALVAILEELITSVKSGHYDN